MIIDSIIYFEEAEMLEFRLRFLWEHVDRFVIVEADRTHSGEKKQLNFFNNKDRFDWAKEKIIYHPVTIDITGLDFSYKPKEFEHDAPQWKVENQQRNAIIEACKDFSDDDILILSDCDEIPSIESVEFRKKNKLNNPMACDQRIVPFFLNYVRDDIGWRGTIMADLGYARKITTQGMRNRRIHYSPFPRGGWHLTYFGGAEKIRKKIQSFAHQELNRDEYLDVKKIDELTRSGQGVFPDDGGQPLRKVDESFYPVEFLRHVPDGWWI